MDGVQAGRVVFLSTTGSFVCSFDYSLSSSITSYLGHFFFVSLLFDVFFPLNLCISSQALPHSFT